MNPSLPDPTADADLWAGEFRLQTASLSWTDDVEQRGQPTVTVDEHIKCVLAAAPSRAARAAPRAVDPRD